MANTFWLVVPDSYRETRPLPPTLAAQCHQLYMLQKLKKPHPTPYLSLITAFMYLRLDL